MTGKEDWEKKYREEIEEVNLRADMLCAWNDELENKLSKYKKAFEILKDKGVVEIEKYTNIGSVIYKAYGYERYLEQEEAELLEELMKDE